MVKGWGFCFVVAYPSPFVSFPIHSSKIIIVITMRRRPTFVRIYLAFIPLSVVSSVFFSFVVVCCLPLVGFRREYVLDLPYTFDR